MEYHKYRWFYTSTGKLVIGGKNKKQNELVINKFLKPDYIVLHTSSPGSPFMIIQSDKPTEKDIKESAIFCVCFSKQWKLAKKNEKIEADIFKGNQIFKDKNMKIGTFGITGKKSSIKVNPSLVLVIQDKTLRAVPKTDKIKNFFAEIKRGNLSKEQAYEIITEKLNKFNKKFSKEEIITAIPSEKMSII